jgi:hypothetical protein
MGGALGATAVGVVSASNRFPAHPVNMKANNGTMILVPCLAIRLTTPIMALAGVEIGRQQLAIMLDIQFGRRTCP